MLDLTWLDLILILFFICCGYPVGSRRLVLLIPDLQAVLFCRSMPPRHHIRLINHLQWCASILMTGLLCGWTRSFRIWWEKWDLAIAKSITGNLANSLNLALRIDLPVQVSERENNKATQPFFCRFGERGRVLSRGENFLSWGKNRTVSGKQDSVLE